MFRKIYSEMMQPGAYFTSKLPDLAIVQNAGPDGNKNPMGSLMIELNRPDPVQQQRQQQQP